MYEYLVYVHCFVLYYIYISNYIFDKNHNKLFDNLDRYNRYIQKYKDMFKEYILRNLSFNIVSNMYRFYLFNKFKKRTHNMFFY